jgi:hypothetical protein
MMTIAARTDKFERLRAFYENAPRTVDEIDRRVGAGELLDFWFDFAPPAAPAIYFRFRREGRTVTDFVRLEK